MVRSLIFAVILLLTGCVVGPAYRPPKTTAPAHWRSNPVGPSSGAALRSFWMEFKDPTLAQLIRQAVANNYDLKIAGERIRAADDMVRIAAAGSLPQVGIGAAVESRRETQTLDWPPTDSKYGDYPYYALGFDASWELDLFGGIRRQKESAQAGADAAVETRRGILVSLTAAVASTYLSLRATGLRVQIARANLGVARRTQRLAHHGFEAGERSHLDVSEADGRVHTIEASIPPLEAQLDELTDALAILLAQVPESFGSDGLHIHAAMPDPPPLPPSLPSEVIAQRPDIRRAEREYAQASANVGVAVAALYPNFSIPLDISSTSSLIHEMFRHASLLWRMGLDGTQSLYSGGGLTANVDAARADQEAALFNYQQTVLRAFGEVEDALSRQRAEELRYQALTAGVADDRRAVLEAQERYQRGQENLLPALEAQQLLYATDDALVVSSLSRCLVDISLFKALGGNWENVALPKVAASRRATS
ncbi:MAG TPA: efflux transporter outer membrane subunit [Steroidobacteraceae bacterium]|jgi:NodT family efflux transporter outer membrane factor (OMF) lipoprotein|nr:efflux transporter outer membrane subunit [Steroidobacteraceae bacterium]